MPTLTASDLRFTISVDKPTHEITFTDVTDYTYWNGDKYASGLLKITDPVGNVIYENAGYASGDYTAPDIIMQADLKTSVTDIIMDLNNGAIVTGDYVVDYKVATYSGLEVPASRSIVATASTKTIVVSGLIQAEADSIVVFGWLGLDTGLNAGSYSIASSSFVGSNLTIIVNETIVDETAAVDVLEFNYPSALLFSASKTFTYCYTSPTVAISYIVSCVNSQLTSTDDTNYTAENDNSDLPYYALTRTHSVTAPLGSGFGTIVDSNAKSRVFTNIWTKIWQTSISSALIYDIESWSATEAQVEIVWYQITDTVSGYDSATVNCESCACEIRQCIRNLYLKWVDSLCCSGSNSEDLLNDLTKVNSLYIQYLQAERCGVDTSEYCTEIAEVLEEHDCSCSTSGSDDASELVEGGFDYFGIREADNDFIGLNTFTDLEMIGSGNGIVMASPDGTKFKITVSNAGALVVTPV
jgi:hypothetical protein